MSSEVAPGTHSVPGATRFGTTSGSVVPPRGAPAAARPRLQDVAALAGVSAKTASRALTGHEHVSPATLARVRDAAQTLGFRPNQLARELRLGAVSTAVGLVVTNLANPFYAVVAAGAEHVLRSHGFELFVASTDENADWERRVARTMLNRRVRAILVVPASDDQSYLEAERRLGTPMVFLDRPPVNVRADSVVLDNRSAAAGAVDSLLAHGHRRIAVLADNLGRWTMRERITGATYAMKRAGVEGAARYLRSGVDSVAGARVVTRQLLESPEPPTAIFALNNVIAAGVLEALRASDKRAALVGFDDFSLA